MLSKVTMVTSGKDAKATFKFQLYNNFVMRFVIRPCFIAITLVYYIYIMCSVIVIFRLFL